MIIIRSGDRLMVDTPTCLTSLGSVGMARLTRFCTSTWAMFRSVPTLNVTFNWYVPSLLDWESM